MTRDYQEADNPSQRLRGILGTTAKRPPRVGVETLRTFHSYLVEHLPMPFEARLCSPVGPHRDTNSPLKIIGLMDPIKEYSPEEMYGLICQAEQNGQRIELPLDRIDVEEASPHYQLLEDYRHWLWNCSH
jgi:hypothetical protein